jgi:dolichol kinase
LEKSFSFVARRLAQLSGIISVGVGDSAASIVGSKIGTLKWPGSKRTLEGSIAGLIAQFLFVGCLWYFGMSKVIFFQFSIFFSFRYYSIFSI